MKRKTLKLVALMLLGVMLVMALASCSSYSKILSNFKKEGYEEKKEDDDDAKKITAELEQGKLSCEVHVLKKENAVTVIILEFSSDKDMTEAIKESATLSGMIEDAQKSGRVRGNCVLIKPIVLGYETAEEIFNK